ncbi:MAG: acylphosphatase [Dehalococcoidales bacterium]|nr:acylphosphatase [Dehalococcoidales bacterium]
MPDLASVKLEIGGLVQGVFFRDFTRRWARELGITGYVRNLPGGRTVAVYAEGDRRKLEELIGHLGQGPPGAKVGKVETTWSVYTGDYAHFDVKF